MDADCEMTVWERRWLEKEAGPHSPGTSSPTLVYPPSRLLDHPEWRKQVLHSAQSSMHCNFEETSQDLPHRIRRKAGVKNLRRAAAKLSQQEARFSLSASPLWQNPVSAAAHLQFPSSNIPCPPTPSPRLRLLILSLKNKSLLERSETKSSTQKSTPCSTLSKEVFTGPSYSLLTGEADNSLITLTFLVPASSNLFLALRVDYESNGLLTPSRSRRNPITSLPGLLYHKLNICTHSSRTVSTAARSAVLISISNVEHSSMDNSQRQDGTSSSSAHSTPARSATAGSTPARSTPTRSVFHDFPEAYASITGARSPSQQVPLLPQRALGGAPAGSPPSALPPTPPANVSLEQNTSQSDRLEAPMSSSYGHTSELLNTATASTQDNDYSSASSPPPFPSPQGRAIVEPNSNNSPCRSSFQPTADLPTIIANSELLSSPPPSPSDFEVHDMDSYFDVGFNINTGAGVRSETTAVSSGNGSISSIPSPLHLNVRESQNNVVTASSEQASNQQTMPTTANLPPAADDNVSHYGESYVDRDDQSYYGSASDNEDDESLYPASLNIGSAAASWSPIAREQTTSTVGRIIQSYRSETLNPENLIYEDYDHDTPHSQITYNDEDLMASPASSRSPRRGTSADHVRSARLSRATLDDEAWATESDASVVRPSLRRAHDLEGTGQSSISLFQFAPAASNDNSAERGSTSRLTQHHELERTSSHHFPGAIPLASLQRPDGSMPGSVWDDEAQDSFIVVDSNHRQSGADTPRLRFGQPGWEPRDASVLDNALSTPLMPATTPTLPRRVAASVARFISSPRSSRATDAGRRGSLPYTNSADTELTTFGPRRSDNASGLTTPDPAAFPLTSLSGRNPSSPTQRANCEEYLSTGRDSLVLGSGRATGGLGSQQAAPSRRRVGEEAHIPRLHPSRETTEEEMMWSRVAVAFATLPFIGLALGYGILDSSIRWCTEGRVEGVRRRHKRWARSLGWAWLVVGVTMTITWLVALKVLPNDLP
ncbi:hypothetical protein FH972_021854 [Carpinus fangiana]|uniref:Uncharacterized protein n=1 Tax=Carpinus fangiana TaxID=176857 RepID=A0A5N6KR69_9ROSI|nr:hypothetical protein FH972_021854 [Carpinus fangiana]